MADTRATVSLSPKAGAIATEIKDRYHFPDTMEVARFGAAVAMAHELEPLGGRTGGPATGTWNLGSLDRDGELRALIQALYPELDEDPAVTLETMMDKGLILLGDLISKGDEAAIVSLVEKAARVQSFAHV